MKRAKKVDAVLTEIVRNGVIAVTEEMKTNLMRTAYNMIIYEALDFTVGLYTPEGETVSIGLGLPSFIRGMAETVKAKLRHFGADGLEPGDILVTNDAYTTGSHLYHFTFSLPIFHRGKLSGFACCMAHWTDVGGVLGGVTTDIYSEGLQIPILKYARRGVVNQDLLDIIRMNVRIPERAMGDLRAQITAVKTGERRFLELLERYGRDEVLGAIANIMDQSEKAARERTRSIPDGTYEAESFMDDDGVEIGKPVPIKVRVVKKGDEMTVDLSQVSPQVRGFFNSGATTGYSCAQVAYKCLTSPTDYPINEGSFRSLKVVLGSGTVVSAVKPAAMRWWMTFPMTVVDTVFKAMEPAVPDRTIAAHHADLCVALVNGLSPKDGRFFIGGIGPLGGGFGAKRTEDGVSGTVCMNDGDTHNHPVEQMEAKYPMLFERHALRQDSGGPGRYRGGLGTEQVVQARSPININVQVDRVHCQPWGLAGGDSGAGNQVTLRVNGQELTELPNAKVQSRRLNKGDAITIRAGGGGGFGPPHEREPERVLHDVREGYVSIEAAAEKYGVIIDPRTLEIVQLRRGK
jgi:N-methylhydantoinase B